LRDPFEDLHFLILNVADVLRTLGYRVSTAEIVKAVQVAEAYRELTGGLDRQTLSTIIKASFTIADPRIEDIEQALRRLQAGTGVRERAEKIVEELLRDVNILGVKPGAPVSRKRIARRPKAERKKALASYLRLKRLGAIRGGPGRERLVDRQDLERLAWRLARRGYEDVDEALEDARFLWGWDDLLAHAEAGSRIPRDALSRAPEKKLIRLAEAARRKNDTRLLRSVAEELAGRALRGSISRKEEVSRILDDAGLLTPSVKKMLARGLDESTLSIEEVASLASQLEPVEASRLVARKMRGLRPEDAARLVSLIDPGLLWAANPPRGKGGDEAFVGAAVYAGKALREAVLYAETGAEGRADMALHYAGKARELVERLGEDVRAEPVRRVIQEAESIIEMAGALRGGAVPKGTQLDKVLAKLDFVTSVRVLRSLYSRAPPEWRSIAEAALERMLYKFSSREGLRLLPESEYRPTPPGRFEVRRSIYNMLRLKPRPFTYRRRLQANPLSLALDASGSMMEYAAWSIGVASIFPRHVRRLVVFRDAPIVYEGPFTRRLFASILLSMEFRGYTNIAAALEEAARSGVRRIVVVTDLYQTVDTVPVESVVADLSRRGKRVVFIVPRLHDREARAMVEKARARVLVAPTPREAARLLLRALLR